MRAGDLNELIDLQKKSITRDALNAEVVTWITIYPSEPAKVEFITAREIHAASQIHAVTTLRVTIHIKRDVTAEWRALWNGDVLSITGPPMPSLKRDYLTLLCGSGLNNG